MAQPNPDTTFDRGAWLTLAGSVGVALLAVATAVAILALPADGWQMPYDEEMPPVGYFYADWPTPLRAGDVVLAVNGRDRSELYADLRAPDLPASWRAGETVTYTIQRGEEVIEQPVELHQPDATDIWRALAHAAGDEPVEWSWSIVALVVFLRRPRDRAARLLLAAMLVHSAVTKLGWAATTASASFAPTWLRVADLFLGNFWTWLFWPAIILLMLSFPQAVFPYSRWPRRVTALLFGLPLAAVLIAIGAEWTGPVTVALVAELLLLLLAFGLALWSAYRRTASPAVRAQANWVILGFGISQGLVLFLYLLTLAAPGILDSLSLSSWIFSPLTAALPICLGIAITRYRLWDIDLIIRRTLIYTAVSALLALVYFGSVALLQGASQAVMGSADVPAVVVISTLLIAALFAPARRRLQQMIDRRFYRNKYDAARTLAEFAARARDETDLEQLKGRLEEVVWRTMQPAHVGLWLARREKQRIGKE